MRTRLLTIAALTGLAVAAVPTHAGKVKPQIVDPAGDANGVNDQALGLPVPSSTTPVDMGSADITAVTFATTFKTKTVKGKTVKSPTGFTVTMTLAAAPTTPNIIYRVSADTPTCATSVFFEYKAGGDTVVRCPGVEVTDPSTEYAAKPAVVKGNSITWALTPKAFPVGTGFDTLNAQTRQLVSTPVRSVTAPQYDYAESDATYAVGQ